MTSSWIGTFRSSAGDEPFPGIVRQSFDTDEATVVSYRFEAGASFPLHRHAEEQITVVEEGEVEFRLAGESRRLSAGDWAVTAPEAPHGVVAGPAGARILAVIIPRRRTGDAYVVVEGRT